MKKSSRTPKKISPKEKKVATVKDKKKELNTNKNQKTLNDFFQSNCAPVRPSNIKVGGAKRNLEITDKQPLHPKVIIIDSDSSLSSEALLCEQSKAPSIQIKTVHSNSDKNISPEPLIFTSSHHIDEDFNRLADIAPVDFSEHNKTLFAPRASSPYQDSSGEILISQNNTTPNNGSADYKPDLQVDDDKDFSRLSDLFADMSTSFSTLFHDSTTTSLEAGVYKFIVNDVILQPRVGVKGHEKILLLKNVGILDYQFKCILRDYWFDTEVSPDMRINIISTSSMTVTYQPTINMIILILSNSLDGIYLILDPDRLVSGTTVAGSYFCTRKTILQELIRSKETELAKYALYGQIVHEVFQKAIKSKLFDISNLTKFTNEVYNSPTYLDTLYTLGINGDDIAQVMKSNISNIISFSRKFVREEPIHPDSNIQYKWQDDCAEEIETSVAITDVIDIEENIWNPNYGLKGKIDVTTGVKIHKRHRISHQLIQSLECTMPLELKSGKMMFSQGSIEHRAQVMLYCLMIGERSKQVNGGLLFYSQNGHLEGIPVVTHEIKGIIQKRNELISYFNSFSKTEQPKFPSILRNPKICSKCSQLFPCMLIYQVLEKGGELYSGMGSKFSELLGHLDDDEKLYFGSWFKMIQLEAMMDSTENQVDEIWNKSSDAREQNGYCLGHMVIESFQQTNSLWTYKMCKASSHKKDLSIDEYLISVGDSLILSYEDESKYCVAYGTVTSFDNTNIMIDSYSEGLEQFLESEKYREFRLDKCDTYKNSSIAFMNLIGLFLSHDRSNHLRQAIIHLTPPCYAIPTILPDSITNLFHELNDEQQKVIERVLQSKDYTIVQGMPGTGKTTLTTCLIQVLLALNQSILLSSFTNMALDNILLKLIEKGVDFVRFGRKEVVHSQVKKFLASTFLSQAKSVEDVHSYYSNKKLYAATCIGTSNAVIQYKEFDWCIIDEASQLTQFICIGPMLLAKKFVLVGDSEQLPPLVRNKYAREMGYDVSLFKRLLTAHPNSVLTLITQYRMHSDIMSLSNHLVYKGRMKTATEKIASAILALSLPLNINSWALRVLEPTRPVIFVNCDEIEENESEINGRICNKLEATLVQVLISSLIEYGLNAKDIGVITPYKQQVRQINSLLTNQVKASQIEVSTVDRYQGRDKQCIIVSLVRNNADRKVGNLIPDMHRVNVVVTRAKHKLILIGSKSTLSNCATFQSILQFMQDRSWIETLKPDDLLTYSSLVQI